MVTRVSKAQTVTPEEQTEQEFGRLVEFVRSAAQDITDRGMDIGDRINDANLSEPKLRKLAEYVGMDTTTLRNYARVSREIPVTLRRRELSFAMYEALCRVHDEAARKELVNNPPVEGWKVRTLHHAVDVWLEAHPLVTTRTSKRARRTVVRGGMAVKGNYIGVEANGHTVTLRIEFPGVLKVNHMIEDDFTIVTLTLPKD